MIEVDLIKGTEQAKKLGLESLLQQQPASMLYYAPSYHQLLANYLGSEAQYIIARKNAELLGVIPFMLSKSGSFGSAMNSLPFYGSNGGMLFSASITEADRVEARDQMINKWLELEATEEVCSSTLITNPLYPADVEWLQEHYPNDFLDYRIGQLTPLVTQVSDVEEALLSKFENPRPRNIRKAIKSEVTVRWSHSEADMRFLYKTHVDNIEGIGGIAKEWRFFETIQQVMPQSQYKIWIAEKDGEPISALLLMYYGKVVEYYTPATVHDFRNLQPSSLIIFEAMKEAIYSGFEWWNWGGTWKTQNGVYSFKKKWAASDCNYFYFTRIRNKQVLHSNPTQLLEEYPFFYVLPFDKLIENE